MPSPSGCEGKIQPSGKKKKETVIFTEWKKSNFTFWRIRLFFILSGGFKNIWIFFGVFLNIWKKRSNNENRNHSNRLSGPMGSLFPPVLLLPLILDLIPRSTPCCESGLKGVTYVPYGWSQASHCTLRCGFTRSIWTQKRSFTNGYEFGLISTAATQ